jgi:hypothetical protein
MRIFVFFCFFVTSHGNILFEEYSLFILIFVSQLKCPLKFPVVLNPGQPLQHTGKLTIKLYPFPQ